MRKTAAVDPMLVRGIAGALAGGMFGRYVTPRLLGYEDYPAAVNMSTLLDAAMVGGMSAGAPMFKKWLSSNPAHLAQLTGAVAGSEIMPVGMQMVHEGSKSMSQLGETARKLPISTQIYDAMRTPEARGAMTGAAAAGLGAVLTGLLRGRTPGEWERGTTRTGMVAKDFLKYIIPALLAGGVAGNLVKNPAKPTV